MLLYCLLLVPLVAVHGLTDQEKAEFLTPSGPADCMNQVSLEQGRPNRQGRPQIRIRSNGIPPLAPGDFWEECNGNQARQQNHDFVLPDRQPVPIGTRAPGGRHCVGLQVGIMKDGIPLYSGENVNVMEGVDRYNRLGRIGVELWEETGDIWDFDSCDGHTSTGGVYHYHFGSDCLKKGQDNETFIGVAMDGNPIYDNKPIDVVLDECNGAFVMRDDGLMQYRYYATNTYPFTVGCFRDPPIINGGDECDAQAPGQLCKCQGGYDGDNGYQGGENGYQGGSNNRRGNNPQDTSSEDNSRENQNRNGQQPGDMPPPPPQQRRNNGQQPGDMPPPPPQQQGNMPLPPPRRGNQGPQQQNGGRRGRGGRSRRQTYGNGGQPQGSGQRRQNAEVEAMWTPIAFVPFAPTTQCTAVQQQSVCPFAPRSRTPGLPAPDMMFCMMLNNQIRQAMMQYEIFNRNSNDVNGIMMDPLMLNYQRFMANWSYQQLLAVRQEAVNRGCPGVPPMPPAPTSEVP